MVRESPIRPLPATLYLSKVWMKEGMGISLRNCNVIPQIVKGAFILTAC